MFKKPIAILPIGKKYYPIYSLKDLENVYLNNNGEIINKKFLSKKEQVEFDLKLIEEKFKKGI